MPSPRPGLPRILLALAIAAIVAFLGVDRALMPSDSELAHCRLDCAEAMLKCCPGDGPFCGEDPDGSCMQAKDTCEAACEAAGGLF